MVLLKECVGKRGAVMTKSFLMSLAVSAAVVSCLKVFSSPVIAGEEISVEGFSSADRGTLFPKLGAP